MIDPTNTVVRTVSERCRLYKEQDHAKLAPNEVGEVLWRAGGFVFVKGQTTQRCVRGVPLTKELWLSGDGPAEEPANDNVKGARYPLEEEFKAKRLGKWSDKDGSMFDMSEGAALWKTTKWFLPHYELANRPYKACSYGIGQLVTAGDLGGYVDPKDDEAAKGSTDPMGYQIEMDPLSVIGGIDASFIESTGPGESKLHPAESRTRSVKICQEISARLQLSARCRCGC